MSAVNLDWRGALWISAAVGGISDEDGVSNEDAASGMVFIRFCRVICCIKDVFSAFLRRDWSSLARGILG